MVDRLNRRGLTGVGKSLNSRSHFSNKYESTWEQNMCLKVVDAIHAVMLTLFPDVTCVPNCPSGEIATFVDR